MNKPSPQQFLLIPILPFFTVSLFFVYQFSKLVITEGFPSYLNLLDKLVCLSLFIVAISIGVMFLKSRTQTICLLKLCLIFGLLGIVQQTLTEPGRDFPNQVFVDWFAITGLVAFVPSAILAIRAIRRLRMKVGSS